MIRHTSQSFLLIICFLKHNKIKQVGFIDLKNELFFKTYQKVFSSAKLIYSDGREWSNFRCYHRYIARSQRKCRTMADRIRARANSVNAQKWQRPEVRAALMIPKFDQKNLEASEVAEAVVEVDAKIW